MSIYSHTLHTLSLLPPPSSFSPSLSLFSYKIPLSLLKGSILRKHTEEAHRGKGGTRREGKYIEEVYRGKGSRIVTVVMKQGSTN
jgi:stalled ribosome alternative rescue factor ArfA